MTKPTHLSDEPKLWGIQYYFHIELGLTVNPPSVSSVTVTEDYSSTTIGCTIVDSQAFVSGTAPGSLTFYCQIRLSGTFYNCYYYLSGMYNLSSGTGYIDASLRHD